MARLIIILVVAAVVFTVFSVIDCAVQPATRHRGVSKGWWIVITCVPVVGGLLWFLIGRGRGLNASRHRGPLAPDDDPAFLGTIGSVADQDERIRRLEEELAKLDDEDGPAGGTPKPTDPDDPSGDDSTGGSRGVIG